VKRIFLGTTLLLIFGMLLTSCGMLFPAQDSGLESTRVALAIQQTSLAMNQSQGQQAQPPAVVQEQPAQQPTYTPYPTYTSQVVEQPTAEEPVQTEEPEQEPAESFEDWMKDATILLYDAMWGRDTAVIENAIDGLALGRNTTNVKDAVGNFISSMNSANQWDLVIVASEWRSLVQGEVFDVIVTQLDRGSSVIFETWYIDQVYNGRIQPILQRCGISFHRDWWRAPGDNLNDYLVYLLELDDPMFSQPNTISMLVPYGTRWIDDVGDTVKINPGSDAVLLAGRMQKEYTSYGLMVKCMDGRLIWQTFSTHDYKDQDMTNMWQNYIYNALLARYEYINKP